MGGSGFPIRSLTLFWYLRWFVSVCLSQERLLESFVFGAFRSRWAGVSHILLDYLVGVHPSPLFWPISTEVYTCPVGILPSAGALDVRNPYLYRNLGIELGILVPFFSAVALMIWRVPSAIGVRIFWVSILLGVSLCFTVLSMGLNR
jgi:inner membrane protein